jgi:carbon-monoxide dehydrogenase small subunit
MTATVPVRLLVNGERHEIQVEPRRTLADALREDCRLTGTHLGCEHGEGVSVRTVEGLAPDDDTLHPVQQAFWDNHGLQCGFCTPGFLMLITGVLEENPEAGEEELRDALSSNLCRCTGYQNIVKASLAAAEQMRP